jgi:hypothetical protein
VEDDEFEHDLQARVHGDMEGALPVPSTEEYSSDGGSEGIDDGECQTLNTRP